MSPDKEKFIADYTTLIAGLNRENHSRLWWATDIASKNRANCLLAQRIQEHLGLLPPARRGRAAAFIRRCRKIAAVFRGALWMYVRALMARLALGKRIAGRLAGGEKFYIIKTFSYDGSFDAQGEYHDIFFGRLPQEAGKHNKVLLFVNVLGDFHSFLGRARAGGPSLLVPLETFLRWSDVREAVVEVLKFRVRLKAPALFGGHDVTALVKDELYATFNGIQVHQLLHYHCTRRLLERCACGAFVMTYENNPWERMCTLAVREHSPGAKIIGYQHSVVRESSLGMFMHPGDADIAPLPDEVLTVGEVTAEMLRRYGNYTRTQPRPACALRYEYLHHAGPAPAKPWQGHVLVVLDGVAQSGQLLEYISAQGLPPAQVRLRAHPAFPRAYWQARYRGKLAALAHMQWSQGGLQEDLDWADAVVYWQSTVAWEALSRGIPVISFAARDILSYDPLLGHSFLRWSVEPGDPLADVLEQVRRLSPETRLEQYRQAKILIERYFYPVSAQNLDVFL